MSEQIAIERLHELLNRHGVGTYKHTAPEAVCLAFFDGKRWHDCWESVGGEVNVTFSMTPEQAIAATLGDSDATATRQGDATTATTLGDDEHTTALMTEFVRVLDERDTLRAKFEVSQSMGHAEYKRYTEENAKLQKQGARLFDKTLELADENAKLLKELEAEHALAETLGHYHEELSAQRTQLRQMVRDYERCSVHTDCAGCEYDGKPSEHCPYSSNFPDIDELHELGNEVDE